MTLWINVFYINDQKLCDGYIEVRLIKIIFISHHAVMSLMYCWDISANEVYRVIYSILSCTYMHTHTHTKAVPCSNVRVVLNIRAVCQLDSELKKHTHYHGNQSHKLSAKCTSHFPAFKSFFFLLKETHQAIFWPVRVENSVWEGRKPIIIQCTISEN